MSNPSQQIAAFAEKALLYEVALSPKPGLVDRQTNGAHQDMDFYTFIDSITSLAPFFFHYAEAGYTHQGTFPELFEKVRRLGIEAEKKMLQATKGVNTHKGANFSFAVLLAATGFYLQKERLPFSEKDTANILQLSAKMTQHVIKQDFEALHLKEKLTYGEKLYLEQGITGIRGEAAQGYPALSQLLLPFLRENRTEKKENVLLRAMVLLMSEIEDSNLLHRGGFSAWQTVKEETKKIHQANLSAEKLVDELAAYDSLLITRNLSPGGTADLLALGIYFAFLEELF
ncbi:triphosphoribosyl-dephospho-CoA synthase CitG [Enterococcus massiliensis]|uniref:triphosphoribosyl-dephospho-CoA synthase CitG n=1 Tax=Enterococcus massiliensis TaxID=1640685 RepID=UPI00065E421C|nr:triphosphoribosyl-dephospho-CoA synthase CitG [Enterococcus massiliensis]